MTEQIVRRSQTRAGLGVDIEYYLMDPLCSIWTVRDAETVRSAPNWPSAHGAHDVVIGHRTKHYVEGFEFELTEGLNGILTRSGEHGRPIVVYWQDANRPRYCPDFTWSSGDPMRFTFGGRDSWERVAPEYVATLWTGVL